MTSSQAITVLHQSIDLIERYATCILKDSKTQSEAKATLDELGSHILHFSNCIEYNSAKNDIFENFVNMVDSSPNELICDAVLKDFHEQIEQAKENLSGEQSEKYLNFMKLISQASLNADDDITTISQSLNTVDPITKLPIVEPVKNKNCGHVYEKSSILQLITQNKKTKCPIAGCNKSECVKKSDLVPDTAFKRILSGHEGENCPKKLKVHV